MNNSFYDVIVVGGSVAGCLTAHSAAVQGLKVLLIEPRTYLGREFTANLRPWIGRRGWEDADEILKDILGIRDRRITDRGTDTDTDTDTAKDADADGDEIPLQAGRIKKNVMNMLRGAGVHLLLMSGPAGVLTSNGGICGVVIGNKSGIQAITAKTVVDATENGLIAQLLGVDSVKAKKLTVKRTIEFHSLADDVPGTIELPQQLGVSDNRLLLHKGTLENGHYWAEFSFEVDVRHGDWPERMQWEHAARKRTIQICEYVKGSRTEFGNAVLLQASGELWHSSLVTDIASCGQNFRFLQTDNLWYENQDLATLEQIYRIAERTADELNKHISLHSWNLDENHVQVQMNRYVLPLKKLDPRYYQDNWSGIACFFLKLKHKDSLPHLYHGEVVVAGGGTAGAPAAIGAASNGSNTIVIEGNTGLGGTGTLGGINLYWYGYTGGFTAELDSRTGQMTDRISNHVNGKLWNIEAKMMAYLEDLTENQGLVLFRTTVVDVIVKNRRIQSVVVLSPDGLGLIHADIVIDGTGDGDLAAFAGIPYKLGDGRGGNLQTFNLCDWSAKGALAGVNLDLGVMDIRNIFDVTRGIIIGHANGKAYDFSPYPANREARHVDCEYTLTVEDVLLKRKFTDTIAIGSTDFDQHSLQSSDFAKLGYLPYHVDCKETRFPLRACIAKGLDNLLITGKAFSAERDAFSFLRMQPDLQNMGYAVGLAASLSLQEGVIPGRMNITRLQSMLLEKGNLRPEDLDASPADQSIPLATLIATSDQPDAFLQLLSGPKEQVVPVLKECLGKAEYKQVRLPVCMALAWYGERDGVEEILASLRQLMLQEHRVTIDKIGRPVGGFVGRPDTYWQVIQHITVLGRSGDPKALELLCAIAKDTDAGGPPANHAKVHWRRIPHYEKIICLCNSMESLGRGIASTAPSHPLISKIREALEALIRKPYLSGYAERSEADGGGRHPSAYLEMVIARTMACFGSERGLRILIGYLDDVQAVLSEHAHSELAAVTGKNCGKSSAEWLRELFPQ